MGFKLPNDRDLCEEQLERQGDAVFVLERQGDAVFVLDGYLQ